MAKFVRPGDNEPKGFILTTILGVVGCICCHLLGQAVGGITRERRGFIAPSSAR